MIGDALDERQMGNIVLAMAALEQPWNCPHGRPTMQYARRARPSLPWPNVHAAA
jgi:DNA mismatch repair protein PMS2